MNSILYFDPARDRWDTRRPDALRNRVDPPSSISILTVTWTAPPSGGSGSTTASESEIQAARVDRIIRDQPQNNIPTVIALAGVPRAFIQQLLTQTSIRQGYAFSSLEGDNGSCALLWKISFAVFFVEPNNKVFPCMLAHSRELFGAPAVISTAVFPTQQQGGGNGGSPEHLRELWEGYLGSVGQDSSTIAVCFVGSNANTQAVANLRQSIRPARVEAASDGPHAVWFRAADGRQIQASSNSVQSFGDRVTQITLSTLSGGQSPQASGTVSPIPHQQQQQVPPANNNPSSLLGANNKDSSTSNSAMGSRTTTANTPGSLNSNPGGSSQSTMKRTWNIKANCNIKVRENTVEILYDLSPIFTRPEDCIRSLNSEENFRWNSDFAICHGRLYSCNGIRADIGSFQRWMREHDPPITHTQRSELINKGRLTTGAAAGTLASSAVGQQGQQQQLGGGMAGNATGIVNNNTINNQLSPPNPASVQHAQQHQTAAQHLFGNNNSAAASAQQQQQNAAGSNVLNAAGGQQQQQQQHPAGSPAIISSQAVAAASGAPRFYRRGWTVNRAVLLHQVGPVELQAFDVTAELGVLPRPLPTLVDRLNGISTSQQYAHVHQDPLASYSRDYALCFCGERRGYWLVAAPNVPCDPLIARAVALQLKKQRQQQQQLN